MRWKKASSKYCQRATRKARIRRVTASLLRQVTKEDFGFIRAVGRKDQVYFRFTDVVSDGKIHSGQEVP
jgi:hypothetical protein